MRTRHQDPAALRKPGTEEVEPFCLAGHAVLSLYRGNVPEELVVGDRAKFLSSVRDHTLYACRSKEVPLFVKQHLLDTYAQTALAGQIAVTERMSHGTESKTPFADSLGVAALAKEFHFEPRALAAYFDYQRVLANLVIQDFWPAVQEIAVALKQQQRLSGVEIRRLWNRALSSVNHPRRSQHKL